MCMLWNAVIRRKYDAELDFTTQELYIVQVYLMDVVDSILSLLQ